MDPTAVLSDADAAKGCCVAVLVVLAVAVVVSCGVSPFLKAGHSLSYPGLHSMLSWGSKKKVAMGGMAEHESHRRECAACMV